MYSTKIAPMTNILVILAITLWRNYGDETSCMNLLKLMRAYFLAFITTFQHFVKNDILLK